jgi:hypothetical protein
MRVGDVGNVIRARIIDSGVPFDLSSASVLQLKFLKPSGVVIVRTATVTNSPGTDGRMHYETVAGDLDESGPWQGQAYVESGTQKFHTTVFSFPVASNLS